MPFVLRCRYATREGVEQLRHGPRQFGNFATRDEAEEALRREERAFRDRTNPFDLSQGCLAELTSLEPPILCDRILDAGAEPPEDRTVAGWRTWWGVGRKHWPAETREHLWRALDRVRPYDVIELRAARKLYVLAEIGWEWHDEPPFTTGPEQAVPREAFTTRGAAERRRRELDALARERYGVHASFEWEGGGGPRDAAPFYRILEIEEELPS